MFDHISAARIMDGDNAHGRPFSLNEVVQEMARLGYDVTAQTIANWLRGSTVDPPVGGIEAFCRVMGKSISSVLTGQSARKIKPAAPPKPGKRGRGRPTRAESARKPAKRRAAAVA